MVLLYFELQGEILIELFPYVMDHHAEGTLDICVSLGGSRGFKKS
jgi:hypothetical protein